jgi:ATP-dependent RNA helicase DeaD
MPKKTTPPQKSFAHLGLKKEVAAALTSLGYLQPTDVQEKVLPLITAKKNVVFTSQTGSGKTIAYSVGFFNRLQLKQHLQMLVIVPTRELCMQVGEELKKFGQVLGFNVGMLYGGHDLIVDKKVVSKRLHIIVATPGRLIQHINNKVVRVGDVSFLVFDESDQMFDTGFYDDCEYIRSRVSATAQLVLSSATLTAKVESFVKKNIPDFEFVEVGALIPSSITQDMLLCTIPEKNKLLVDFFLGEEFSRAIVFVNTKSKLSAVYDTLLFHNISANYLSSDLDQKEREKCVRDFRTGKFSVLVCTDVASHGLDIKGVDIVVNYDVPPRSEFYVHRIGRAGRVGAQGYALTFVCPEDEEDFAALRKQFDLLIGLVNHDFELIDEE